MNTAKIDHHQMLMDATPDTIESAYSGKNGKCCCGCAGKHYEDAGNKARILKILRVGSLLAMTEFGDTYAARVVNNRVYIVYFSYARARNA